jgi:hypothetical protein
VPAADVRPQRNPDPRPRKGSGLSDADILEIVEPVYEWACWASDLGMVDFDTFAELSHVIHELRDRRDAA